MPELVCSADDPRWQDERRKGVTATDITAIPQHQRKGNPVPLSWSGPADPGKFETFTCRICGAVIGIRWGVSSNPTDTSELHIAYHKARGDEGDV